LEEEKTGRKPAIPPEKEEELAKYMLVCAAMGTPLTKRMADLKAKRLMEGLGKEWDTKDG
jgi:hypothetical protein